MERPGFALPAPLETSRPGSARASRRSPPVIAAWPPSRCVTPRPTPRGISRAPSPLAASLFEAWGFEAPSVRCQGTGAFTVSLTEAYGDVPRISRLKRALLDALRKLDIDCRDRMSARQFQTCLQSYSVQRSLCAFGIQPHLGVLVFELIAMSATASVTAQSCTVSELVDGVQAFSLGFSEDGVELDAKLLKRMIQEKRKALMPFGRYSCGARMPAITCR